MGTATALSGHLHPPGTQTISAPELIVTNTSPDVCTISLVRVQDPAVLTLTTEASRCVLTESISTQSVVLSTLIDVLAHIASVV